MIQPVDLTPAAQRVLMNFHDRRGAPLPRGAHPEAVAELRIHKLVNPRGNLTGLGETVRRLVVDEWLDRLL